MKNNFMFGAKAKTLSFLKDKIKSSTVSDLFIFPAAESRFNFKSITKKN